MGKMTQIRYLLNQKQELEIHMKKLEQIIDILETKNKKLLKDIDRILREPMIEPNPLEDK